MTRASRLGSTCQQEPHRDHQESPAESAAIDRRSTSRCAPRCIWKTSPAEDFFNGHLVRIAFRDARVIGKVSRVIDVWLRTIRQHVNGWTVVVFLRIRDTYGTYAAERKTSKIHEAARLVSGLRLDSCSAHCQWRGGLDPNRRHSLSPLLENIGV